MEPNEVFQRLGTNIQSWFECLKDIKSDENFSNKKKKKNFIELFLRRESRQALDSQETYKAFGPLIIDFSKIQSKIGVKYDNWHQDLLRKFGQIIQTVATDFYKTISEVKLFLLVFRFLTKHFVLAS